MLLKRQGDVFFIKMKKSDLNINKEGTEKEKLTVALGEVTGHHHTVFGVDESKIVDLTSYGDTDRKLNQNELETMVFEVRGGSAMVRHDEHDPTLLEETTEEEVWVRTIQREYNPTSKAMERVRD